jgi:hypothetical protein
MRLPWCAVPLVASLACGGSAPGGAEEPHPMRSSDEGEGFEYREGAVPAGTASRSEDDDEGGDDDETIEIDDDEGDDEAADAEDDADEAAEDDG